MRFGIISGTMLTIASPTIVVLLLCFPIGDDPFATVGELLMMFSFPAALLFGILGIVHDRRKPLAIATTLIAGGITLLIMCMHDRNAPPLNIASGICLLKSNSA